MLRNILLLLFIHGYYLANMDMNATKKTIKLQVNDFTHTLLLS